MHPFWHPQQTLGVYNHVANAQAYPALEGRDCQPADGE